MKRIALSLEPQGDRSPGGQTERSPSVHGPARLAWNSRFEQSYSVTS
jgi:hypothetical protein